MTENKRFILKENGVIDDTQLNILLDGGEDKEDMVDLLNDLSEENEQLKMENNSLKLLVQNWEALDEEKDEQLDKQNQALKKLKKENEQLKTIRSDLISELDIVQNELNIAINKGFAPSKSYKNYMASKKTEYDKFWENKIKTHNNTLKELQE